VTSGDSGERDELRKNPDSEFRQTILGLFVLVSPEPAKDGEAGQESQRVVERDVRRRTEALLKQAEISTEQARMAPIGAQFVPDVEPEADDMCPESDAADRRERFVSESILNGSVEI
jgi:hypothetical protein